jgi:hypothetical protein
MEAGINILAPPITIGSASAISQLNIPSILSAYSGQKDALVQIRCSPYFLIILVRKQLHLNSKKLTANKTNNPQVRCFGFNGAKIKNSILIVCFVPRLCENY